MLHDRDRQGLVEAGIRCDQFEVHIMSFDAFSLSHTHTTPHLPVQPSPRLCCQLPGPQPRKGFAARTRQRAWVRQELSCAPVLSCRHISGLLRQWGRCSLALGLFWSLPCVQDWQGTYTGAFLGTDILHCSHPSPHREWHEGISYSEPEVLSRCPELTKLIHNLSAAQRKPHAHPGSIPSLPSLPPEYGCPEVSPVPSGPYTDNFTASQVPG